MLRLEAQWLQKNQFSWSWFQLISRVDLSYFRQPNGTIITKEFNKKKVVFTGVDTDKTYTVLVTLGRSSDKT